MYPILEEFVEEHHRRATVGTVDIDTQPQLAARFKVQGVPTILVIRSGKVVLEVAGILDIDELSELIFE